jgi:hypothetical protein
VLELAERTIRAQEARHRISSFIVNLGIKFWIANGDE